MCEYTKKCDYAHCCLQGEYRAPRSRSKNDGYYYFCLEHIRTYNKDWDYFKGMSSEEIMAHRISDITWRRPTWSAKNNNAILFQISEHPFMDQPIGLITQRNESAAFPFPQRNSPEFKAIKLLKLEYPFSATLLKKQYFSLVKIHHPDINAGCKESEETLKRITVAYKVLRRYIERY